MPPGRACHRAEQNPTPCVVGQSAPTCPLSGQNPSACPLGAACSVCGAEQFVHMPYGGANAASMVGVGAKYAQMTFGRGKFTCKGCSGPKSTHMPCYGAKKKGGGCPLLWQGLLACPMPGQIPHAFLRCKIRSLPLWFFVGDFCWGKVRRHALWSGRPACLTCGGEKSACVPICEAKSGCMPGSATKITPNAL